MEEIYQIDPNFFVSFFDVYSAQELWEAVKGSTDSDCMREK